MNGEEVDVRYIRSPSVRYTFSELQDPLLRDLLGSADGEEEIIDEGYVHDRCILGPLAPCRKIVIDFSCEHTQSEHQGKDPGYRKA